VLSLYGDATAAGAGVEALRAVAALRKIFRGIFPENCTVRVISGTANPAIAMACAAPKGRPRGVSIT